MTNPMRRPVFWFFIVFILALLTAALWGAPAFAVDVQSIVLDTNADTLTITDSKGNVHVYDYGPDLPLSAQDLANARDALQENFYDTVIQRNSLPADDPDRSTDPNHECHHWTGPGQRIVSRNTVVVEITTDPNGDPVASLRNCDRSNPPL